MGSLSYSNKRIYIYILKLSCSIVVDVFK